jgi:hypothetical protein
MRIPAVLVVLAAVASPALAHPHIADVKQFDFKVAAHAAVVIDSDAGSVTLEPGPAGAIHVDATKKADSEAEAQKLDVDVRLDGNVVRVRFGHARDWSHGSVDFRVRAPADSRLEVRTGGGSVDAHGFSGGVAVETGGGSVNVGDARGPLKVHTGGGSVRVAHVAGSVDIRTGGGSINCDGELSGQNRIETGGGSIRVAIPANSRLSVDASTGAGGARNDFGLPEEGHVSRRFSGRIGDGNGGSLQLRTGGGSIALTRS